MSYDESDAAFDEFVDALRREIYAEQKEDAIDGYTSERLKSFYVQRPDLMLPAVDAIQEGSWQYAHERYEAALVFNVSAIEILLKATLLKPVVYGLVHNEMLADIVVRYVLSYSGFDRYEALLAELFRNLAGIDLNDVRRPGQQPKLLDECRALQTFRNRIVHQGERTAGQLALHSGEIAAAVFDLIVMPMLQALGLAVVEQGRIVVR